MKDLIAFEQSNGILPADQPPCAPDRQTIQQRITFVQEEILEEVPDAGGRVIAALKRLEECLTSDSKGFADLGHEICDGIWILVGAAVHCGIDLAPIWAEIRRANMAKFGPGSSRRADGKLLKPPDWESPVSKIRDLVANQPPLSWRYPQLPAGDDVRVFLREAVKFPHLQQYDRQIMLRAIDQINDLWTALKTLAKSQIGDTPWEDK